MSYLKIFISLGMTWYHLFFEGYSIEALPYFGQLLDLSFKMDRYQNWTSSILNIMEEMSAVSSDDSEKVVDLLRSKAEGE